MIDKKLILYQLKNCFNIRISFINVDELKFKKKKKKESYCENTHTGNDEIIRKIF